MELKLKFYDKIDWIVHVFTKIISLAIIFLLGTVKFNPGSMLLITLLSVTDAKLINNLVFAAFVSLMVWYKSPSLIKNLIIALLGTFIIRQIPHKNKVEKKILDNKKYLKITKGMIFLWFLIILVLFFL